MKYQCQACSYTGNHFPGGVCPGCQSHNIKPLGNVTEDKQPKARKPFTLVFCIVLWLYLVVLIAEKLM